MARVLDRIGGFAELYGKEAIQFSPVHWDNETTQRDDIRLIASEGLEHFKSGELEEAADIFERVLRVDPGNQLALFVLGFVAGQFGEHQKARDTFEQLIHALGKGAAQDHPTVLAHVHHGLGAALLHLGAASGEPKPELMVEASGEFKSAIGLLPDYAMAWLGLGIVYHVTEQLDAAEAAFRKVLELEADNSVAVKSLRAVLEDKLERRLFELGYLSKINRPIRDFTPYENRRLIEVEGKPLSETIVEERR